MELTNPRGWLALTALIALIVAALAWGVAGSLPERVSGEGILVRSGGVFEVSSPAAGQLTDISVQVGDFISEGQVVARLSQPDLTDRIHRARARLEDLEARHRELQRFLERDAELTRISFQQKRDNLRKSVQASEVLLKALQDRIASQEELVAKGLLTRQTLLATVQELETVREDVRQVLSELSQLSVQELQLRNEAESRIRDSEAELMEVRRELAGLERELRVSSEIITSFTGWVLEITAQQGSVVDLGRPIITVSLSGKTVMDLEAIVYVPSLHGEKIKPGMEIQISPSTVNKEEYGYLIGRVTSVSDYPTTPGGMMRVLKNEQLVEALSGPDAPYEVRANLIPDPGNISSYHWSSPEGPPIEIQSGTTISASIVVERRRPITLLIPQLRRLEGDGGGEAVRVSAATDRP